MEYNNLNFVDLQQIIISNNLIDKLKDKMIELLLMEEYNNLKDKDVVVIDDINTYIDKLIYLLERYDKVHEYGKFIDDITWIKLEHSNNHFTLTDNTILLYNTLFIKDVYIAEKIREYLNRILNYMNSEKIQNKLKIIGDDKNDIIWLCIFVKY